MGFKEKIVGVLIVVMGAWPFILMITSVKDFVTRNPLLNYLSPGQPAYQIILIVLGAFLLWSPKPRMQQQQNYRGR